MGWGRGHLFCPLVQHTSTTPLLGTWGCAPVGVAEAATEQSWDPAVSEQHRPWELPGIIQLRRSGQAKEGLPFEQSPKANQSLLDKVGMRKRILGRVTWISQHLEANKCVAPSLGDWKCPGGRLEWMAVAHVWSVEQGKDLSRGVTWSGFLFIMTFRLLRGRWDGRQKGLRGRRL